MEDLFVLPFALVSFRLSAFRRLLRAPGLASFKVCLPTMPLVRFGLVQVKDDDLRLLVKEMDTNGDGNVTLKEFAAFINLDDHEPLYQPLFDGRRRNVNILQAWKQTHLKPLSRNQVLL